MGCTKFLSKPLVCGVALSVLALAPLASKADTMAMGDSTVSSTTTSSMSTNSMSSPMMVTGSVVRYYTDRTGYVTAMDLQTADGVKFVRFSPSMGQRLYTNAPIGGTATVYVSNGNLLSIGEKMPTSMMSLPPTDLEILEAVPYITVGAKLKKIRGRLKGIVTSDSGEVVGLIVKNGEMAMMGDNASMMSPDITATSGSMMPVSSMTPMMMAGTTLVRIPCEFRSLAPGYNGTEYVTPLFLGSDVEVVGYPEAPRYGAMSIYENRIAANAIIVNGRSVGALGFQKLMLSKKERAMMSGMSMMETSGGTMSADEMSASRMGYTPYGTMTTTTTTTTDTTTTTTSNQ